MASTLTDRMLRRVAVADESTAVIIALLWIGGAGVGSLFIYQTVLCKNVLKG